MTGSNTVHNARLPLAGAMPDAAPTAHSPPAGRPDRWPVRVARWLLPDRCAVCGAAPARAPLCEGCRGDLQPNAPCCARCAEPLPHPAPTCGRCQRHPPPFLASHAAFRYAWPLDGLLTRFKFGGDLAAGRALARLYVERARHGALGDLDARTLLVPVPLHERRLRQRGFDQALELARDIAGELRLPLAAGLLRRTRATRAQTDLAAGARRRNVRGAFALDATALGRLAQRPPVLLLDDVMTTGSTLAECARVLRGGGFAEVRVWAVARAPRRR